MKNKVKDIFLVTLGSLLVAFSVNTVFVPYSIASGGVTGISIILKSVFNLNPNISIFVLNGILLILALIFLGLDFFLKSFLGSILFPFFMYLLPVFELSDNIIIALVVGTAICTLGVKITYLGNGSSGGTTIPPMIFNKYFGFSVSKGILLTDGIVVLLSLIVMGLNQFVLAVVGIGLFVLMYDYIETGFSRAKALYIISDFHEDIKNDIISSVGRGTTYLNGRGGYNLDDKKILMVVVKTSQLTQVKRICDKYDPTAFIIINTVSEVHGEGFSYRR